MKLDSTLSREIKALIGDGTRGASCLVLPGVP